MSENIEEKIYSILENIRNSISGLSEEQKKELLNYLNGDYLPNEKDKKYYLTGYIFHEMLK